jgi:4-amino-4-deoxy-L-arabinose transferase-like glycosyltransferase
MENTRKNFPEKDTMAQKIELNRCDNPSSYLVYPFVILAVLIGLYFCFAGRGSVHLFGDEFHSIWNVNKPYNELVKLYDSYGSGIALPLMQRFAIDLFGPSLWAYRFPAILGAITTLLIIYPAASRLVGHVPAMIATLALSANSMHIFYSRFGRSYSLMVFLIILLAHSVNRAISQDRPRPLWYIIVALCAGLAPYIHLTTTASVIGIGLGAVVVMCIKKRAGRHWYWLLCSFVIGAVLCISLHLPAWESLWEFIEMKVDKGDYLAHFSTMDVVTLLAGNRLAGIVWLAGIPVAAIWILIKKRSDAFLLVTAALAPVAAIAITKPFGMTYAYARYLLTALPFMLMLLAWLLVQVLGLIRLPKLSYVAAAIGIALVVVSFLAGPLGLRHTKDGPFANTYLSMMPLPAFDVPWEQTPPFYKSLAYSAEDTRIIEVPALISRSMLLYRNYYLQHQKDVSTGFVSVSPPNVPSGPYVWPFDLNSVNNSNANYLILHLNIELELTQYWQFVYKKVWLTMKDSDIRSLMIRHANYQQEPLSSLYNLAGDLQDRLGRPMYKDARIVVWKLKP